MFTYSTEEACCPWGCHTTSNPSMSLLKDGASIDLPINYPLLIWTINHTRMDLGLNYLLLAWPITNQSIEYELNYPTLAWPYNHETIGLSFNDPTFFLPINITHRSIGKYPNRAVFPWPLYSRHLAAFSLDPQNTSSLDLAADGANDQSSEQNQASQASPSHQIDLAVNGTNHQLKEQNQTTQSYQIEDQATDQSSEEDQSDRFSHHHDLISSVLSEEVVKQNIVTDVKVTEDTITVYISPVISGTYVRPDCQNPTTVNRYDSDTITVQGLGVQGKAVRYVVDMIRLYYVNDEMKFTVFTADVPGIRSDIKVTDEVVEVSMYFIIDRNLSLRVTAEVLDDLYRVETSSSALDRWKIKEAEALPSIGQLIQQLNAKKAITQLHLDEYKATGTKSWELCVKDEHGRLIFSIALKKRDAWHIKVILRWFRILGLKIEAFYCDFWLAYPPAIKAIYPKAEIQFDFFHVMQNIHRHLYKDFTTYRKLFKNSNDDQGLEEAHKQLHKQLWKNRYLLFTNEENLDDKQRILLDQLIEEHRGTIVEQIVVFRWYLRDIFNESDTYDEALEKLSILILDGWAEISTGFTKSLSFLQEYFRNMATYLRVPTVQRNSLSECTVRTFRRIESIRQGFKSNQGRTRHLKLLIYRKYLRTTS